jgi:hypothetical protein
MAGLSFNIPGGGSKGKPKLPTGTVRPLPKGHKWKPGSILVPQEALDMIQMYIPESIEERFAEMWRSGPKNEVPSHVSWHERLRQLLSPEVQLHEEMDVEKIYLLFAELLILQSKTADPEYADRLLSLIEIKKNKRKRNYNWMD